MFQHNSGTPGAITTKLGTHDYIYIIYINIIYNLYIYKWVCLCVCMFQHNSGTPGANSTKLGTHMTIYRCPRRNVSDFGRVFLRVKYTDITQNTYGDMYIILHTVLILLNTCK
jgi:hypothetical protein